MMRRDSRKRGEKSEGRASEREVVQCCSGSVCIGPACDDSPVLPQSCRV